MKKIKKCVIPAAGMWTRFLPATKALPKEMFPIIDKPVMQYLIEEAISAGCEDIIIITGKNKRAIEDHFDSNFELEKSLEKWNKFEKLEMVRSLNSMANIVYARQPYPKWDGEAILRVKSFVWNEPFLVLFWDDIVEGKTTAAQQLVEAYNRKWSPVIATIPVSDTDVNQYWIIESSEDSKKIFSVDKFLEKPTSDQTTSRKGVIWKYILTPEIFHYLEKAEWWLGDWEIRLADAFELMRQEKDIYWLEIEGERFDTWSKIGFIKAIISYGLERDDLGEELREYLKSKI